jgi:branched-chain amino acid transport system substrate-binding protein
MRGSLTGRIAAVLLVVLAVGCRRPERVASGRVVRVGVIGPLTGADAQVGKSGLLGVELALGLRPLLANGDTVELVVLDDGSTPEGCADAYKEMSERDVVAVLVLSRSGSALELEHRARVYRLPIIAAIASHPELTEGNSYAVQLCPDDRFQGSVAAMFLRDEMLFTRAVVVDDPSDVHAAALAEAFARKFDDATGLVVGRFAFSAATRTNLVGHLEQWREEKVRLVYAPLQAHRLLEIMRGMKELDWHPTVMAGDGALSEIMLEHREELPLVEGLVATDTHGGESYRTPFGQAIWAAYQAQDIELGTTFTVLGAEGMSLLLEALDHVDPNGDSRDLLEQLRAIDNFEGFTGTLSVGEDGRVIRPVYVNTIREGHLDCLVRVY